MSLLRLGRGPSNLSKSESGIESRGLVSISSKKLSGLKLSSLFAVEVSLRLEEVLTSRRGMERCGPKEEAAGTEAGTIISIHVHLEGKYADCAVTDRSVTLSGKR